MKVVYVYYTNEKGDVVRRSYDFDEFDFNIRPLNERQSILEVMRKDYLGNKLYVDFCINFDRVIKYEVFEEEHETQW